MLLWEMLEARTPPTADTQARGASVSSTSTRSHTKRLPFDLFCCAVTKSGRRCRGKIRKDSEYCVFHDPELATKRQKALRSTPAKRRRKLSHLPDGYLRKLSDHRAIGQAMDRLYREIRLGIITPDMGRVMFAVLTRILDSGLADLNGAPKSVSRTKAARLRPKLADLLTRTEKAAWKKAVAKSQSPQPTPPRRPEQTPVERAVKPQRLPAPQRPSGTAGEPVAAPVTATVSG